MNQLPTDSKASAKCTTAFRFDKPRVLALDMSRVPILSPDEQTRRLEGRIDDGRKIWKLSPMDLESYSRWYEPNYPDKFVKEEALRLGHCAS